MNHKKYSIFILYAFILFSLSCASHQSSQKNPLKNTPKLVVGGHSNLYNNGAFHVPQSSIYLIPPGPDAYTFAMELMGERARQSFLKSIKKASESVYIVAAGTTISIKAAKASQKTGSDIADYIKANSREGSMLLMDKSMAKSRSLIGDSWTFSKEILFEMDSVGNRITESASALADRTDESGTAQGQDMMSASTEFSKKYYKDHTATAKQAGAHAVTSFVEGYLAAPEKLKNNMVAAGDNLGKADLSDIVKRNDPWREKWSGRNVDLIGSTLDNYQNDVKENFSKASAEFGQFHTTGVPFATLKAMRWVVKGLMWDAAIEPAAKITSGGLGYVAVNCLAYPVMIIEDEGQAMTRIAVDVTWNASKSAYQLVAPSAEASLAGTFSALEFTTSPVVAGLAAAGGNVAGAANIGASKAGSLIIKGTGAAAGKTTQYVGVPLAAAGVVVGGSTVGVAVIGAGVTSSGTIFLGGETAAVGSDVFGNVIALTTVTAGTAASTAGGAAYGVYQLSKATTVPPGYELGGGIILSYETMSQLSAQAILAVADCAYLVLSLEGERWVVYAVKGNLGKGDDLVPGTVMDLKKMQNQGEVIVNLPLSDEEMKKVVSSTYKNLPEMDGALKPVE